jgi:hypothetical protein
MATVDRNTVKSWFVKYAKPTADQFARFFDSIIFKGEKIPTSSVEDFDSIMLAKADNETFENHVKDSYRHLSPEERIKWNNKVDKENGKMLSSNDYTDQDKQKLKDLKNIEKISSLQNDKRYTTVGDPMVKGNHFQCTPLQVGYKIQSSGAIVIQVPANININALTLYIDICCPSNKSSSIIINSKIGVGDGLTIFQEQDVKITTSNSQNDYTVRFHNGNDACIYIGETSSDFRLSNVAITRAVGHIGINTPTPMDFKALQEKLLISVSTKFKTIHATLRNNLVQGKSAALNIKDQYNVVKFQTSEGLSFGEGFVFDSANSRVNYNVPSNVYFNQPSWESLKNVNASSSEKITPSGFLSKINNDLNSAHFKATTALIQYSCVIKGVKMKTGDRIIFGFRQQSASGNYTGGRYYKIFEYTFTKDQSNFVEHFDIMITRFYRSVFDAGSIKYPNYSQLPFIVRPSKNSNGLEGQDFGNLHGVARFEVDLITSAISGSRQIIFNNQLALKSFK